MKISLKLLDNLHHHHDSNLNPPPPPSQSPSFPPLLLRAKIPVTVFSLPFLSQFSTTTTHPSDLSLSLSTNLSSGPSLKVTYFTSASSSSGVATPPPFTLTMKSGTGLFGSPKNSPVIISAHFSFNPSNPNYPNPTFSLFFKPQLGSFSLRKSTFSHSEPESVNGSVGFESSSFDFVPLEKPGVVEKHSKLSIFKGFELAARTHIPFAKTAALNFRWTTMFFKNQMPILRITKLGLEKTEFVPRDDESKSIMKNGGVSNEVEILKCMCSFMKKELDDLKGFNFELKRDLEKLKTGDIRRDENGKTRKVEPSVESGFEAQKIKRNRAYKGNTDERKEDKRNGNGGGANGSGLENELQRAIKTAAA